jgi:hypothetical protein
MDFNKIPFIYEKVIYFNNNMPLDINGLSNFNLKRYDESLEVELYEKCDEYLFELQNFILDNKENFFNVNKGIVSIRDNIIFCRNNIYRDYFANFEDFLLDYGKYKRYNAPLFDYAVLKDSEGFILLPHEEEQFIKENYNREFDETIRVLERLYDYLLSWFYGYDNITSTTLPDTNSPVGTEIRESLLKNNYLISEAIQYPTAQLLPAHIEPEQPETQTHQLNTDSHKVVLLFELGIIDFLKEKYYKDFKDSEVNKNLVALLTNLIDIKKSNKQSTLSKSLTGYKNPNDRGNYYTEPAVKEVNKVLIDAGITQITFDKKKAPPRKT